MHTDVMIAAGATGSKGSHNPIFIAVVIVFILICLCFVAIRKSKR